MKSTIKVSVILLGTFSQFFDQAQTQTVSLYTNEANRLGDYNTYLGYAAGANSTPSNARNVFIGRIAGQYTSDPASDYNVFIGYQSGYRVDGKENVFVGYLTGGNSWGATQPGVSYNTLVGSQAGQYIRGATANSFFGRRAGHKVTFGDGNTLIGQNSGYWLTTGSQNTVLGNSAGDGLTTGYNNVLIGTNAGGNVSTGFSNVFIGYGAGHDEAGSNKLYIDNSSTANPLIHGDFAADQLTFNGDVGIGTSNPFGNLHIRNSDDGADQYSGIRFYPAKSSAQATLPTHHYHRISGFRRNGLWISGSATGSSYTKSNILLNDNGISFGMSDGVSNPEDNITLALLNNGDVGIGTTAPALLSGGSSRFLEIEGTSNPGIALHNTNSGGRQFLIN